MKAMNVEAMSNEDLQDMFSEAYESQVASLNNVGEFEATCEREYGSNNLKMNVLVVGLAGSPTIDDYKEGRLGNADTVVVDDPNKGMLTFQLVPEEIHVLNSNDYVVVYEAV